MGKAGHVLRNQKKLIAAFESAGATTADHAITEQQLGIGARSWVKRDVLDKFVEFGIAYRATDSSYYLDQAAAHRLLEHRNGIRLWAMGQAGE